MLLRAKVERATFVAARRYTPGHYAGHVSLFLPCEEWVRSGNEPLRLAIGGAAGRGILRAGGCNSDVMLRELHAPAFAELFKQCRARSAKQE